LTMPVIASRNPPSLLREREAVVALLRAAMCAHPTSNRRNVDDTGQPIAHVTAGSTAPRTRAKHALSRTARRPAPRRPPRAAPAAPPRCAPAAR
jgi:hypothetical protein